ncbi:unnamed protein product [Cuscuta epithymum]|uniref:Uncharacterized protein n=1 Tax=Cuscuta epithymum TaxID=186058 RepID=A0AAV0DCG6_9ASTE|nr:unnamed protein product [Cuscuta epithymum]
MCTQTTNVCVHRHWFPNPLRDLQTNFVHRHFFVYTDN